MYVHVYCSDCWPSSNPDHGPVLSIELDGPLDAIFEPIENLLLLFTGVTLGTQSLNLTMNITITCKIIEVYWNGWILSELNVNVTSIRDFELVCVVLCSNQDICIFTWKYMYTEYTRTHKAHLTIFNAQTHTHTHTMTTLWHILWHIPPLWTAWWIRSGGCGLWAARTKSGHCDRACSRTSYGGRQTHINVITKYNLIP
jgi:hypothetical protein